MRASRNVVDRPSAVRGDSAPVESSPTRVFGVVKISGDSVDESDHVVFPITNMISPVQTNNPGAISASFNVT